MKDNSKNKSYLGINPYGEENKDLFKGRSKEIWQLFDRIIRNTVTVYYAETGEGKSSLIKAGVFPVLRRRDFFPVYITLDDNDFSRTVSNDSKALDLLEKIRRGVDEWNEKHKGEEVELVLSDSSSLTIEEAFKNEWFALRCCHFKQKHGDNTKNLTPLYVFDQFEEVFTKGRYEWINGLINQIGSISSYSSPEQLTDEQEELLNEAHGNHFRMLFSLRTEWLGDLDYWCAQKHFIPELQDNRLCLKPLTPSGAEEVIGLNEELREYKDDILKGCAKDGEKTENGDWPCIYALVLSVVCQELSGMNSEDRKLILENLRKNQEKTIDNILYQFYHKTLDRVGLKDEATIERFELALVDTNGKRRRRDMGESDMEEFKEWIYEPSKDGNQDKNLIAHGLIKDQGKTSEGEMIVELPHDRLCRAIDNFRKERNKKKAEQLQRLKEWMKFGVISAVLGLVSIFIWVAATAEDSILKPLIQGIIGNNDINIRGQFDSYLFFNRSSYEYNGEQLFLDEGFSTILLIALCSVIFPLLVVLYKTKKSKGWDIIEFVISIVGFILFAYLGIRNYYIPDLSQFVFYLTILCVIICFIIVLPFIIRIIKKELFFNPKSRNQGGSIFWWPYWGDYFLFALSLIPLFLFNDTFGIPSGKDSIWALIVLPLLSCAWTWCYFSYRINKKKISKFFILASISIWALSCRAVMSYYLNECDSFSIFGLVFFLVLLAIVFWMMSCDNVRHCIKGITINGIILFLTAIFVLGYNPLKVRPNSVVYVSPWNTVLVKDSTTLNTKDDSLKTKLGFLTWNGDTILPCRIEVETTKWELSTLFPGGIGKIRTRTSFKMKPIKTANLDGSFVYNDRNHVYGWFNIIPSHERYLMKIKRKGLNGDMTLQDSIEYYAVELYKEIRKNNLQYIDSEYKYKMEVLKSYKTIDSLQSIAWENECGKLDTANITKETKKNFIDCITDKEMVTFFRELSRRFLLLQLRNRVEQEDYPSVFTLARIYPLVFFPKIIGISYHYAFSGDSELIVISGKDVNENKLYAWYNVFRALCISDVGYNEVYYQDDMLKVLDKASVKDLYEKEWKEYEEAERKGDLFQQIEKLQNLINLWNGNVAETVMKNIFKRVYTKKDSVYEDYVQKTLDCLIPVLQSRQQHVYYNDFRCVCEELLVVSEWRRLEFYNKYYNIMDTLAVKRDSIYIRRLPKTIIKKGLEKKNNESQK